MDNAIGPWVPVVSQPRNSMDSCTDSRSLRRPGGRDAHTTLSQICARSRSSFECGRRSRSSSRVAIGHIGALARPGATYRTGATVRSSTPLATRFTPGRSRRPLVLVPVPVAGRSDVTEWLGPRPTNCRHGLRTPHGREPEWSVLEAGSNRRTRAYRYRHRLRPRAGTCWISRASRRIVRDSHEVIV